MIGVGWFTVAMFTNNPLLDFGIDALYEYTHMPEWLDLLLVILYYVSLHFIASSWSKGRPLKLKNYTKQLIDGAFFLLCLGLVYFEPEEDWFAGAWSFGAYLHTVTVFGCLGYSRSFRFDDIFLAQLICRWVLVMSRGCSSHGKVLLLGVSLGLQLVKNFMREEFERGELEEKRFVWFCFFLSWLNAGYFSVNWWVGSIIDSLVLFTCLGLYIRGLYRKVLQSRNKIIPLYKIPMKNCGITFV